MAEKNLSMREVGIESGLDHQVIRRLKEVHAKRPNMTYCILLADYFGVNPNEFLQLAGWPALKVFDIKRASIDNLPTEAVDVALDIAKIPDPRTRKQVAEAVRVLLKSTSVNTTRAEGHSPCCILQLFDDSILWQPHCLSERFISNCPNQISVAIKIKSVEHNIKHGSFLTVI